MMKISIQKGNFNTTLNSNELIEIVETSDGINFNFKQGLTLVVNDLNMPIHTKNIIKNTADNFLNKKIIFNLDNYNKPVMVDMS